MEQTNTKPTHAQLAEAAKRGAKQACPGADDRWLSAVAQLVALDYADYCEAEPDDDFDEPREEATEAGAERWGHFYADNVAEFPGNVS